MQDVRVLVRQQAEVPVIVIRERREIARGCDEELDLVVGDRDRGTVGRVGVIRQQDLGDVVGAMAERTAKPLVNGFAESGDTHRNGLESGVVRDVKVAGLEGPTVKLRIVFCVRIDRERRPDQTDQKANGAATHDRHAVDQRSA